MPTNAFRPVFAGHAMQSVSATGNGAPMAFVSPIYKDIYFNPQSPEAEKNFVFLQGNGLPARFSVQPESFVVAELGFGFGLNCALLLTAAREARFTGQLVFFSVDEQMPSREAVRTLLPKLGRARAAYEALWLQRDALCRGESVAVLGARVQVFNGQVHDFFGRTHFLADAWFFDGFSPAKNPLMWSSSVFAAAFARTRVEGTFATYSSAGWVRRNLAAAGFVVDRVPGFAGKREMLTGKKGTDAAP